MGLEGLRMVSAVAAVVLAVYVAACAALFLLQRSLIYFPQPRWAAAGAQTLTLPVDGADLVITVLERSGPAAVVYFGGNAEDVSQSLAPLAIAFPDRALYLMHYRGYGGSSGAPSEAALVADALRLFDRVLAQHTNIVVIGRSLGSGVAIQLASARPVDRLVLITPYDSLQDLAAQQFPYMPVRWLLRDKFESGTFAAKLTTPTLLIAAENDEVIPRSSTDALHARFAADVATLRVVPGTGHNTISASPEYTALLRGVK
ncbi:MAG TPA: alpha/beta fold hydrolase [Burkholderiaceae bacterium]|nr:alpha/beta fold hydrolase [Burkholderiaceae bacterium]